MTAFDPTALFAAIRQGDAATVRELTRARPEALGARNDRGTAPLTLAAYLGKAELTRILVEAGAEIDAVDSTGTALLGAAFKGYDEIVAYLLERGADPAITNASGGTALTFAAMFNRGGVVDLLLTAGARTDITDLQGKTPLDYAREGGFTEITEKLK